jgi:hypothetical protein
MYFTHPARFKSHFTPRFEPAQTTYILRLLLDLEKLGDKLRKNAVLPAFYAAYTE